jgi:hypothetical protein
MVAKVVLDRDIMDIEGGREYEEVLLLVSPDMSPPTFAR